MTFPPKDGTFHFAYGRELFTQMLAHANKGVAGVDHVVYQQDPAVQSTSRNGNELRDVQGTLLGTGCLAIAAGRQYAQRHIVNTRQHIAHTNASPRQAYDFVELPARFMNI